MKITKQQQIALWSFVNTNLEELKVANDDDSFTEDIFFLQYPECDVRILKQMAKNPKLFFENQTLYEEIVMKGIVFKKGNIVKAKENIDKLATLPGPSLLVGALSYYHLYGFLKLSFGESICVLAMAREYKRDSDDMELCLKIGVYSTSCAQLGSA